MATQIITDIEQTLEDTLWESIAYHAAMRDLDQYFHIGDTKTLVLLNGEEIPMVLADFNHNGHFGTVDFIAKDCMRERFPMNFSSTCLYGWSCSNMRAYLNGFVLRNIANDCRDYILEKTITSYGGSGADYLYFTDDKLWLLSEKEVGIERYSNNDEREYYLTYPIFNSDLDREKCYDGLPDFWWLLSPRKDKSHHFCYVNADGKDSFYYANSRYGVVFGMRLGIKSLA